MAFTGSSFLLGYGWGTTTSQALDLQAKEISDRFRLLKDLLNGKDTNIKPSEEEQVYAAAFVAAIPTDLDWPQQRKHDFAIAKRQKSHLTHEQITETQEWQKAQLDLFHQKQKIIEGLSKSDKQVLETTIDILSALVINIYLRQAMIYPLARDQIQNGEELFAQGLEHGEAFIIQLRIIRERIGANVKHRECLANMAHIEQVWQKDWEWERESIVLPVVEWMRTLQVPNLAEVSGTSAKPIPSPSPPPNQDLNYGQQFVQMWQVLRKYHLRTGFFQGIPKPRHEPDWSCKDGFELFPSTSRGSPLMPSEFMAPKPEILHNVPSHLDKAADVIQPPEINPNMEYPPIGLPTTRFEKVPDAQSEEDRKRMEELQKEEISATENAIKEAHKKEFGSVIVEKIKNIPTVVQSTVDKTKSYFEWLTSDKHTDDLDGSYNKVEVQLASRNHGTHFEALGEDITPLGNHYLLIHFDVQHIKPENYRLKVHGCVQKPTEWTLEDLKNFGKNAVVRQPMVMECSGNGRGLMKPRFNHHVPWQLQAFGCYIWSGIPLRLLLQHVGLTDKAVDIVFTGYDAGIQEDAIRYYQRAVEVTDPIVDFMMVCWENNGVPLLREHGFPLRILTPGWYGDNNVKWLQSIEVVDHKCKGHQMVSYSYVRQHFDLDLSVPSQEIRPRAMLKPIGYPSFMERNRFVTAGTHVWHGKVWVGGGFYRSIALVEVSLDDGKTWKRAKLEPRIGIFAWHNFSVELTLDVGMYKLRSRAVDSLGHQQKAHLGPEDWNWHGMCDDACQTFDVVAVNSLTFTT